MNKYYFIIAIVMIPIVIVIIHFINYTDITKDKTKEFKVKPNTSYGFVNATKKTNNNNAICDDDTLSIHKFDTISSSIQGWELIWQDEFENNCLNTSLWNIEDWASEKNKELQYYSPENVKVEDGKLIIISKNEMYKGRNYTSGAVHTKGNFDFLYGKAEMRARLPSGQGIFPAFWMMANNEDTWLPEIDIMEMLGHKPNEIWMVSHWLSRDGKLKSDSSSFKGQDFSKNFHTFSIEWANDSIKWFIDGIERFRSNKYVPSEKMYLYLNTAVGGVWPGSPDETTVFPINFEIDYVRVYKKK